MSTAARVPETYELSGDDARETLRRTGRGPLLRDAFLRLRYSDGFSHARSLAFALSLVVVQATIAVVGLASALGAGGGRRDIVRFLHDTVPGPAGQLLTDAVDQARRAGASQQYLGLFLGLAGALVTATAAMGQIERGLNRLYGVEQDRPTIEKYVHAAMLAATAGALAVVAFVALAFGSGIRTLTGSSLVTDAWLVVRWPLGVAAMMLSVAVLFERAPRRRQPTWSWLAYGSGVGVALWLAVTALLGLFFSVSSSFGRTYGPLAGIVALQLWAFLSSVALLYGGALAAQLEAVRAGAAKPQDEDKVEDSEPDQEAPPLVGAGTERARS
jgi:YihY family inner membrane protein